MTITDPIADLLIRMKNAVAVKKETVSVPYSKMKMEILKILKKEGYIDDFEKNGYNIEIKLRYFENRRPALTGVRRISRPGGRIYASANQISKYKKSYGVLIISTSAGIMSDKEAKKKSIGGELICEVW